MFAPLLRSAACGVVVVGLAACPTPPVVLGEGEGEGEGEEGEGEGESCVVDDNTGFPAPLASRTDRIGSSTTLDIAAWNIRNFPRAGSTVSTVADVITSLDLDLIALEEMEDEDSFNELLARLPEHEGLLSTDTYSDGSYQKLAFIYRCGRLTPTSDTLIFTGDGFNFPRPPMQVQFHYDDGDKAFDFIAIAVHLKAQEDAESAARRRASFISLQTYVNSLVEGDGVDEIVILGDFNEALDNPNWAPFLDTSKYVVRTQPLFSAGDASFISAGNVILDHIVTTRAFDDEVGAGTAIIPRVDSDVANYRNDVSDHRPVALILRGL
ncbi:MAG: endonuclease/exonuclease/phosphatase family protein [Deltaproteobacteria bacterium]|nr:endonuclease/exonuclease/phosphatase family protein [Deltaproteobacteria bacterium]